MTYDKLIERLRYLESMMSAYEYHAFLLVSLASLLQADAKEYGYTPEIIIELINEKIKVYEAKK